LTTLGFSQNNDCKITNNAFGPEEKLTYIVSYSISALWTDVVEVVLNIEEKEIFKKPVYHLIATGITYPSYDVYFKVRDRYQSWVDPVSVKPIAFKRDVSEGGYYIKIKYLFNRKKKVANFSQEKTNKSLTVNEIPITSCTFDLVSMVYYARNLNYANYRVNDIIPITILLDEKLTEIHLKYKGKEKLTLRKIGEFNCIKFGVYLKDSEIFEEEEDLEVWFTDDKNRIPLFIESPIYVGSIQVRLKSMKGMKNKVTSKIK